MSEDEERRSMMLRRVECGALTIEQASRILGLSYRQLKRVWKRWREEGDQGLAHRSRGKPSNRAFRDNFRKEILRKYKEGCRGLGPTHFAEYLAGEGIEINHETLRRWLLKSGMWRATKNNDAFRRQTRERLRFGELLTLLSVQNEWLGEGRQSSFLFFLRDEATARTLCYFSAEDSNTAAMRVLWTWIERYGIPATIRCRKRRLRLKNWRPTLQEQLSGKEPLTPFSVSCEKLGVDLRVVNPSQVSGILHSMEDFIDSLKVALWDRRPVTLYDANRWVRGSLGEEMNSDCITQAKTEDFHVKIVDGTDLRTIFCVNRERCVGRDLTIEHNDMLFKLDKYDLPSVRPNIKVVVSEWLDGSFHLLESGKEIPYIEIRTVSAVADKIAM